MPQTKLANFLIDYQNSQEYHNIASEIFTHNTYYFEADNNSPKIIDAGAHIGLATLYFKKIYPNSQIIAIEPNPQSFQLLQTNVNQNNLENITLHQVALTNQTGSQTFYIDTKDWHSTSNFTPKSWDNKQPLTPIQVNTLPLSDFITHPIDLLKLDVEGSEFSLLKHSQSKLHLIKQIILEFHPSKIQSLDQLIKLLTKHNFEINTLQNQDKLVIVEAKNYKSRP